MPAELEILPDEPILIQTYAEDYVYSRDGQGMMERLLALLDQQSQPVFFIMNLLPVKQLSFDDLVQGSNLATRETSLFQHPKIRASLIVTDSSVINAVAAGLNSSPFGNIGLVVFRTMDEALEYARSA